MVWFQCEDCGDQLKKPKLPNHFRICSAYKFSCIDCGQVFDQESVQGHTQCITEAEKYGPKGQTKASNGTAAKPSKDQNQKPDFDIYVGLSERPPFLCSLCNTKATSKQTLLLHAEGKKHRAKAKAFHAKQQPKQLEESTPEAKIQAEEGKKDKMPDKNDVEETKMKAHPIVDANHENAGAENGNLKSEKKRKLNLSEDGHLSQKNKASDTAGQVGNGEVIQAVGSNTEDTERKAKKAKSKEHSGEEMEHKSEKELKKKIKWKKLITSALKSNPDRVLKKKKLKKLVLKAVRESGITTDDEDQLSSMLEHKINSSSRFSVDKKYVRLVSED